MSQMFMYLSSKLCWFVFVCVYVIVCVYPYDLYVSVVCLFVIVHLHVFVSVGAPLLLFSKFMYV